jgi:hypothetical protein
MRNPSTSKRYAAARRDGTRADPERRELALLEEFNRSNSVAALAGAIAARLGRMARSEELIAEAGLTVAGRDR